MQFEPELNAMNDILKALKELEPEAQERVVNWVTGKLNLPKASAILNKGQKPKENIIEDNINNNTLAEVFAATNPNSDSDKVLVVATYIQNRDSKDELTGREINKELVHLGHGVGNITNAISGLMNRTPKLMIQTRKDGSTKQAQKKYKVTIEGLNAYKKMFGKAE
ncbi:MAG TPA: hypothetical protein DEE98_05110 [Elusimicrobia bacterium]|nr:MAG: hypothetical protein A2278_04785 [Elusimicrobia bacterium RIFOXYA12_FULL_49_49]OGS06251.1 MAG: hypothetical protein A2204_06150 [Elusimicrobia bacterium RIFOXYA1_FULL_47_7]OGS10225.1 MAG: hypothetical protein A2386_07990 [Elusimicrobia bacterium RIFOXYB1_FULL_48_9]OGS14637.1 MAG: hypothetical protein A2251_09055 [Elusimicrobia bacterium RIFOXYA2_FULL_47_53]OGS25710.1 MAG: hypothetical protein A2339_06535 [Elusimicrobia bacterium RIFOXYB12_FULL_50_12]OGS31728.1 MAG: hypothetical protein